MAGKKRVSRQEFLLFAEVFKLNYFWADTNKNHPIILHRKLQYLCKNFYNAKELALTFKLNKVDKPFADKKLESLKKDSVELLTPKSRYYKRFKKTA